MRQLGNLFFRKLTEWGSAYQRITRLDSDDRLFVHRDGEQIGKWVRPSLLVPNNSVGDSQIAGMSASKLTGTLSNDRLSNVPMTKLARYHEHKKGTPWDANIAFAGTGYGTRHIDSGAFSIPRAGHYLWIASVSAEGYRSSGGVNSTSQSWVKFEDPNGTLSYAKDLLALALPQITVNTTGTCTTWVSGTQYNGTTSASGSITVNAAASGTVVDSGICYLSAGSRRWYVRAGESGSWNLLTLKSFSITVIEL